MSRARSSAPAHALLTTALLFPLLAGSSAAQTVGPAPSGGPVAPDCPTGPLALLVPGDAGAAFDVFGSDAVLHEERLLVGRRGDDSEGEDVGSVQLFARGPEGWAPAGVLRPPTTTPRQYFGWTLAAHGDLLVVGAPGNNHATGPTPGAAHVYRADGPGRYTHLATLSGEPDDDSTTTFGLGLAVENGRVVVGAPFENTLSSSAGGAVYVFEPASEDTWIEVARLEEPSSPNGGALGVSIALDGDRILAGAPYIATEFLPGRATFFVRRDDGSWVREQVVKGANSTGRDRFGMSVLLRDGRAWAGSPRDLPPTLGEVTAFTRDARSGTWVATGAFLAPDPQAFDRFGQSLALQGDRLAVSAPTHDNGKLYLYDVSPGAPTAAPELQCALLAPAEVELYGGLWIGFAGRELLAGNPYDALQAEQEGSLTVYAVGAVTQPETLGAGD